MFSSPGLKCCTCKCLLFGSCRGAESAAGGVKWRQARRHTSWRSRAARRWALFTATVWAVSRRGAESRQRLGCGAPAERASPASRTQRRHGGRHVDVSRRSRRSCHQSFVAAVTRSLTLSAWCAVQGVCNGRASVRLSHRSTAAAACGEFAAEQAGDIDQQLQQMRLASRWEPTEEAEHRLVIVCIARFLTFRKKWSWYSSSSLHRIE